ncbi:hypothetical protein DKM44_06580 [Deinococcus irradiatisoli]|uniref:Lipoprotein n=1 Tax=Deinococcus irradiatisoli TaxID=2202254 RepID=A0A2Z3JCP5_9DEIO|nr:hypothetical protein DKM44_06580 [Deinococcus irradiatisoli]
MSLTLGAALLAGCGALPLPSIALPDQNLSLPLSAGLENYVAYDDKDAFTGTGIPSLLSHVQIAGKVAYAGAGNLKQLAVYLRSSLPNCNTVFGSGVRLCAASGESAQRVGTLSLQNGVVTGFVLSGAALDAAAKVGHGYFGVQAVQGSSISGDTLNFTDMRASAKL